jgi:hypothetical protein
VNQITQTQKNIGDPQPDGGQSTAAASLDPLRLKISVLRSINTGICAWLTTLDPVVLRLAEFYHKVSVKLT